MIVHYNNVELRISSDCVTIIDSYKIKHIKDMIAIIKHIKQFKQHTNIANRSLYSMLSEWRAHNLLYWLNIERDRTAHCDLDNESSIRKILYAIISLFYFGQ